MDAIFYRLEERHHVLDCLDITVRPGQRTLETGCGYSTIIFALKGARHTVISPVIEEHQHIREWCKANQIDLWTLEFKLAQSEDVLPALDRELLDLVLIDGWHAFPAPFLMHPAVT
jgi:predicted O-methyltransferase YrrM